MNGVFKSLLLFMFILALVLVCLGVGNRFDFFASVKLLLSPITSFVSFLKDVYDSILDIISKLGGFVGLIPHK